MTYFVAIDVGCIECGEDTSVLGIFTSRDAANEVCVEHKARQKEKWSGQHSFEVFEVGEINKPNKVEY